MTIGTVSRLAGPFAGNDVATVFAFTFKVYAEDDILAIATNASTGVETTLTLGTDYSISLNVDQEYSPGGTLTLLNAPLATGTKLVITTNEAALQGLSLNNQGGFYPEVLTDALDKMTILLQQALLLLSRCLAFPVSDTASSGALPPAPARAGKLLMFDANGDPALVALMPGAGVPAAQGATGTVDGTNRTFTFLAPTETVPAVLVFVGGIFQSPTDYSDLTSTGPGTWQITFNVAPVQGPVTVAVFA